MSLTLSILLGLVSLICFLGGTNILLKGATRFLPKETPPQFILDNLVRFLSGIYIGSGFLFVYAAFNVGMSGNIIYLLGLAVIFSGLGRLYSTSKLGSAGKYFDYIMVVEILLGLSIIVLEWQLR
ncbi:DUF4345 domain-containing protein [Arachidicoccus sp.]|jgi:hypothetical protein|uniref:DUF4345 domain-containing protein n=1 Tax=Arachidicoccus sp. TaxID=1872624 RepID=UPI003D1E1548